MRDRRGSGQRARRATIADVAELAGVSKTSVSFAFNKPDRLNPDTATRIRDAAVSLGYRPHPVARMLTLRRTATLGVLTPQALPVIFDNPFFSTFSAGVAAAADEAGYALTFLSPFQGSLARSVDRATIDGFVAIGLFAEHPEVEEIRRAGVPMVVVDSASLPDHPSITVDDEGGAYAAAEHLVALGHRSVLVLNIEPPGPGTEPDLESVMSHRLRGYRAGLATGGITLPDDAIFSGPSTIEGGRSTFQHAWAAGLRPTAVLAMSDAMAIGAMRAVREVGLAVPRTMSVVGFDDVDMAEYTDPPLTTVHQPVRRKGEEAVRLLLGVIHGSAPHETHLTLETRLIVRGSTARASELPAPRNGRG